MLDQFLQGADLETVCQAKVAGRAFETLHVLVHAEYATAGRLLVPLDGRGKHGLEEAHRVQHPRIKRGEPRLLARGELAVDPYGFGHPHSVPPPAAAGDYSVRMRLALIGLGTVGQGVVELLRRHRSLYAARVGHELEVVAALVRDVSRAREFSPDCALITSDAEAFLATPSDIVIEVAGGIHPTMEHLQRALASGRDVVTANKALLAAHAPELFRLAEKHRRRVLFEAAVAGGVPIIKVMTDSLASNSVQSFAGILNGTCNFILTEMAAGGNYEAAIQEAQRRGFAEADPTLDVSGDDSLQKLCVLASLTFGRPITSTSRSIMSQGITQLTSTHLAEARKAGGTIRLLAFGRRAGDRIECFNGPMFVPGSSPLARVEGSDMGVVVKGDAMSHFCIAGSGAGRFPTASAVVADILEAARLHGSRDVSPLNGYPFASPPATITEPNLAEIAGLPAMPEM